MARPSQPWFRDSKGTSYCTLDGKKVRGRENEKEAIQAWHRLFANGTPEQIPAPKPKLEVKSEPRGVSVHMVIDAFLSDSESRTKAKTLRVYSYFLLPFAEEHREQLADALTPTQAEAYSRQPSWKPQTRHGFLSTLVSAFRWAERAGMFTHHALRGIRKPPKVSRGMEALITPEEYAQLEDAATPAFRLLLKVLWAIGCRPSEAAAITAENFDADAGLVRLTEHKTAYKGKVRAIYLPPEIVTLLARQRDRHQSGALLRNNNNEAWTENAIGMAMRRTTERAGVTHAIAYGFRHSFATDALERGVPDAQVAELLGHSGTAMWH